ncbi:hypothetical protein [Wolbachia endosymbiont of Protocalliphora sialia]
MGRGDFSHLDNYLTVLSIGATIGGLTGLALNFTTLSQLVIGVIISSITPALFTVLYAGILLYKFCKKYHIEGRDRGLPIFFGIVTLASAAIGVGLVAIRVGLAAAATAIFPGAMLEMESVALAGPIIAPIAFFAGIFATHHIIQLIQPIHKKVNEYIISPIVECFSSKGEESNLPAK